MSVLAKRVNWPMSWLVGVLMGLLPGCGGLGYTPPPGAKLGDAFLSLTVSTNDRGQMPQGADVVISIENADATNQERKVILGDVIKLSQSDMDVKVNFPIDRRRLSNCGKSTKCQLFVKVVKDGQLRYQSLTPLDYKAGQTKATISISKAT